MTWVHVFFVFILARCAIAQIREGSDWFATVSIAGIILNALALLPDH